MICRFCKKETKDTWDALCPMCKQIIKNIAIEAVARKMDA